VTYLVALGSNFSALWILVGNSFMQNPQGAVFNPVTMRLELTSFGALFFSEDAQTKFVHTSIAGYVTAAVFVTGVSAYYMLRRRHMDLAKRSFRIASLFGVLSVAGVITLGDALGFVGGHAQPSKLAAMEAMWQTEQAPAPFTIAAWPNQHEQRNVWSIQIPYVLTPLLTHTFDKTVPGIDRIEADAARRVRNGIPAVEALKVLSSDPTNRAALAQFEAHQADLGYGFLVKRYAAQQDVSKATDADIAKAAKDAIPNVFVIFWVFRAMVGCGLLMLAYFVISVILSLRGDVEHQRTFLKLAPWMIPVPFIACEAGWLTAEVGRQPWTVFGVLPTWMSASTHSVGYMVFSLVGFIVLYSIFIVIEAFLMVRAIRQGPDDHGDDGPHQASTPPQARRARVHGGELATATASVLALRKEP
jgi:cytochrome d ubiquinol oxidase subunit I